MCRAIKGISHKPRLLTRAPVCSRTSFWPSWRRWNRKSWTRIFWRSRGRGPFLYRVCHPHHYHPDQVAFVELCAALSCTSLPPLCCLVNSETFISLVNVQQTCWLIVGETTAGKHWGKKTKNTRLHSCVN